MYEQEITASSVPDVLEDFFYLFQVMLKVILSKVIVEDDCQKSILPVESCFNVLGEGKSSPLPKNLHHFVTSRYVHPVLS